MMESAVKTAGIWLHPLTRDQRGVEQSCREWLHSRDIQEKLSLYGNNATSGTVGDASGQ